jgi:hypothetical protein
MLQHDLASIDFMRRACCDGSIGCWVDVKPRCNEGMNLILTLITESIEIEETIAEEPKRMGANNFIANSNSKNIQIPNLPQ